MSVSWAAMARLLRRTGFGTTGPAVDAALAAGPAQYVATILGPQRSDPGAVATPMPTFDPVEPAPVGITAAEIAARNVTLNAELLSLGVWWLRRMVAVEQPFTEKLTFCWHNHFAISAQKVRQANFLAAQNETLRRLGTGNFRDLALAMLTDAAMLNWLDGEANVAAAPNENLAREFMELFALGHGDGYTETDVREGARALTGWLFRPDGSTYLSPRRHDYGVKTFLGVTGDLDEVGYCDAVLARPQSPRYLATRWWGQLASGTPPSSGLVDRLAAAYGPDRSLAALFGAILTAPEFTAAAGSLVIGPVEWLIGAARTLTVPLTTNAAATHIRNVLIELGQVPFLPPDVSGWPSGQAWLSSAAADIRVREAWNLVVAGDISAVADAPPSSRLDATAHLLGIDSWSSRSAALLRSAPSDPRELVAVALNTPEYLTN